ncbi:MAG: hypothetical protein GXO85_08470 [Chlorobi bacterium]|nr:hypothetical protein [Chlorobiota bacterium]
MKIKKEYEAKLDNKNRFTVRESNYSYYQVSEFDDGTIVMKPRVLIDPQTLSDNTLKTMDKSIENYKKGKVSKEIKIEKYLEMFDEEK